MLIPWAEMVRKYGLEVTGVLHVGAHMAEELDIYNEAGVENVWWVEANPFLIPELSKKVQEFGHRVIWAAVSDVEDEPVSLHVTNNGQSSSILDLKRHYEIAPDVKKIQEVVVRSRMIDSLVNSYGITGCNFLNLDIQGAELQALKGAKRYLDQVDWIYSEVNLWELYTGGAFIWELDEYLAPEWIRVETNFTENTWGDALWMRREAVQFRGVFPPEEEEFVLVAAEEVEE